MAAINANDKPEPYSLEELNGRIDEAERQFESGEVIDGEIVHKQMRLHLQRNALRRATRDTLPCVLKK